VAFGSFSMTLAFERHSGLSGASPTTDNPAAFVAALNTTFVAGAGLSVIALFTSALRSSNKTA
jgi:hypothetical protein